MTARLLVRHADALTRLGLAAALQDEPDVELLPDDAEVAAADVLAIDYDGAVAHLRASRGETPSPAVLVLTASDRESDIRRALELGVKGYLLHGCSLADLALAVRETARGRVHLGAPVAQRLAESIYGATLTAREEEVLRHVVEGLCNKEIATLLDLSVGTVKSHLRAVFAKLEVRSRTHAVAEASRRGLLRSDTAAARAPAMPMRLATRPDRGAVHGSA